MPETPPATSPAAAPASAALADPAKPAPAVDLSPLRAGLTWVELRTMPMWLGLHFGLCWLLCYWGYTDMTGDYFILLMAPGQPLVWGAILFFRRGHYDVRILPRLIFISIILFIIFALCFLAIAEVPYPYGTEIYNFFGIYSYNAISFVFSSLVSWIILLGVRKVYPLRIDAASLFCVCASSLGVLFFCLNCLGLFSSAWG